MQSYSDMRYIFPPRPEIKTPVSGLPTYERMGFIGQPKLNGSCAELYLGMDRMKFMNRHQASFARNLIPEEDLLRLHRGSGPMVLCGEYMNKSKRDGNGQLFNGCLVLFDILVYNGQYLTGTSFLERLALLDSLFPTTPYDKWIDQVSKNVYRVKSFESGFSELYKEIVQIDMYEGWVLKKPGGILEAGFRPANNMGWQLKARKPTKNYSY